MDYIKQRIFAEPNNLGVHDCLWDLHILLDGLGLNKGSMGQYIVRYYDEVTHKERKKNRKKK